LRIAILAVGRMKAGPERELLARYQQRVAALAPQLGLAPVEWREFDESRARNTDARRAEEAKTLLAAAPRGATIVALDERGKSPSSEAFSAEIARARDGATPAYVFIVGGPDGLHESARAAARSLLSFGAMTWPHQLARVMLAEQLYRACSILARHPYHRE
jgi:23S rRNA (pseudouridine1915-N3)-methyltransferase